MEEENQKSLSVQRCMEERVIKVEAYSIFNELRLEDELCDAVIKADGVEFKAHKLILCGCSPYFRALFRSDWNLLEKREYSIPGVSAEMMRMIIDYAYTHSVEINCEKVEELLKAADYLLVPGLKEECCRFLETQLCLENCFRVWTFAETFSCTELQRSANLFALHHFPELVHVSQEFPQLSLSQLERLVEKNELNVKHEETVFEAIMCWISHAPEERKGYISVLLPKVRLGLMMPDYFMNEVKNNPLVKNNKECRPIIINALKALFDLNIHGLSNRDFNNPLTRPRLPNNILLAISGWSGGGPTNCIEAYDVRANRWVNVTTNDESPRAYHGTAFLNGFIYCVGGYDGDIYFNSVRKFSPVSGTWHEVAPMYSRRCYVSVCVINGCLYAMGGFDGSNRVNTVEFYKPDSNQWTMIAPMHEQRSDASATSLNGKVYICGGFNGIECLFTAECYNPETNQWSLIAPMMSRRSGVGVIAYGDHVYAVGGFDGANRLKSAEAYNPQTNTWRVTPPMISPRSNFGIEVVDDLLFVVGGFNGFSTTSDVEYYDERLEEWSEAQHMEINRSALSCCIQPTPLSALIRRPQLQLPASNDIETV
ncbi:kelch-like protein 10 [Hoplias malabaricus]|uniref:kelch-like protein 10 n=1 Tax=Hoplias malabaricus TaxID=27720 RepID=UPI003462D9D9